MSGSPGATLTALPLVRRSPAGPERILELSVEMPAAAADGRLLLRAEGSGRRPPARCVPRRRLAPSRRGARAVGAQGLAWTFLAGAARSEGTLVVGPARSWRVSLVHFSHHDVGYTDLPSVAARQQLAYLDRVVAYCDETADYPVEARFRWTLDTTWPLPEWLASRGREAAERLFSLAREGRIEITALCAAFNAGLPDLEELVRSIGFACELRRRYRVPVRGAVTTDIPGHPWALVPVLARSGIRYLTTSVNALYEQGGTYRALEPRTPKPFRWIGPDGSEVLVWNTGPGANYGSEGRDLGFYDDLAAVECRLPAGILALEARGYAYDSVGFRVGTDNRPPDRSLSDLVRAWNDRYLHPTIVLDTATGYLAGLEAACRGEFPAVRGDWTDWWLDGPGSSARETALSRETRERLLAAGAAMAIVRVSGADADAAGPTATAADAAGLSAAYDRLMLFDEHTWGAWDTALAPDSPDVAHHWLQKAVHVYAAERSSRDLLAGSLGRLAGRTRRCAKHPCLAVFNPCSWPRTEPVLAMIPDALVGGPGLPVPARGPGTGTDTAFQIWSRTEHWTWRCETTIAFIAADVPAFGWRVYDLVAAAPVRARAAGRGGPAARRCSPVHDGLENDRLRIVFDRKTGGISSLRDLVDSTGSSSTPREVSPSASTSTTPASSPGTPASAPCSSRSAIPRSGPCSPGCDRGPGAR